MKIKDLTNYLESVAPLSYQESYDNSGLLVGDAQAAILGVLISLDMTEAIVDEAISKGCNVVVAHHPIIFSGLKRLTGRNYVERVVMKAIKHDIALYAIHTNLDNMYRQGVNTMICKRLGLEQLSILSPKPVLQQWQVVCADGIETCLKAIQSAFGESHSMGMTLTQISENTAWIKAHQSQGSAIASILNDHMAQGQMLPLQEGSPDVGGGMLGKLPHAMPTEDFLSFLKDAMGAGVVRHTAILAPAVSKIAVCGGAGSFMLAAAKSAGADVFVTGDYKYHEFFDADGQIMIADIGHFESEQYTIQLLFDIISEKFSNFALHCTELSTNPVFYK